MSDHTQRQIWLEQIRALPAQLAELTAGLTLAQLATPFIPGEWSVAQNVHHVADSHMNSFIRLKLILAEDHPTLRPYDQDVWASTPEANLPDLSASLQLIAGLHARWAALFERLDAAQWQRTGFHPENGVVSVEDILRSYAAHGEGHLDQIRKTLAAAPAEVAHRG